MKHAVVYPVTSKEKESFHIEYKLLKPHKNWKNNTEDVPDIVGKATVLFNNKSIKEMPIYYKHEKKEEKRSLFEFFRNLFIAIVGVKTNG